MSTKKTYTVIVEYLEGNGIEVVEAENATQAAQEVFNIPEVCRVVMVFSGSLTPLDFETSVDKLP